MEYKKISMEPRKRIALVAHDHKKQDLVERAKFNRQLLSHHCLYATGTAGAPLEKELRLHIEMLESGPRVGNRQIGQKRTLAGCRASLLATAQQFFRSPC